jgi:hypothetical protein
MAFEVFTLNTSLHRPLLMRSSIFKCTQRNTMELSAAEGIFILIVDSGHTLDWCMLPLPGGNHGGVEKMDGRQGFKHRWYDHVLR